MTAPVTNIPGRIAYEADVVARPFYEDGTPRRSWEQLSDVAKWSWERNPTPRFRAPSNPLIQEG